MSKRLILVFIGFSLLLSFHLYSAKTSDLQAVKEQACKLVDEGKYAEASALIDAFIAEKKGNSELPEALYWVAERYRWAHKWQEAKDLYQYINSNYPKSDFVSWANLGLARADVLSALDSRDLTKAEDELDIIIADFHDHPDTPETLYWLAREFGYAERHSTEKQIYEIIIDSYTESPFVQKAKLGAARAEIQSLITSGQIEQSKKAVDTMKNDFASHPDLQDALYWIGTRYEWSHRYEDAKDLYQEVIESEPNSLSADKAKLSDAKTTILPFIESKDYTQASQALDKMTVDFAGNPELSDALCWIAEAYWYAGQYEDANNIYQKIRQQNPCKKEAEIAQFHMAKSNIVLLSDSGQKEAAQVALDKFISDYREYSGIQIAVYAIGEAYCKKAYEYEGQADFEQAKKYYRDTLEVWEKIITDLPTSVMTAQAYYGAGACCKSLGEYEKAIQYCQQAVNDWPDFRSAWQAQYMVGLCYDGMEKAGLVSQEEAVEQINIVCDKLDLYLSQGAAIAAKSLRNKWNND